MGAAQEGRPSPREMEWIAWGAQFRHWLHTHLLGSYMCWAMKMQRWEHHGLCHQDATLQEESQAVHTCAEALWRLREGQNDSYWRGTTELGLSEYAEVHPMGLDAGHGVGGSREPYQIPSGGVLCISLTVRPGSWMKSKEELLQIYVSYLNNDILKIWCITQH